MNIRKLDAQEDFEATESLFVEAFSRFPWNDNWSDKKQLDAYMRDVLTPCNALCFGFFDGEKLVGIALGRLVHFYSGNQFRLDEFCIKPELQNKGLGSEFMEKLSTACLEEGIAAIVLVTENNFPAYGFYLKNGFSFSGHSVCLSKALS